MKKIWLLIVFVFGTWAGFAQIMPYANDYLVNPLLMNSALAAKDNYLNINLATFKLFALPESPSRLSLTVSRRKMKMGGSFQLLSQKIGPVSSLSIGGSYFYEISINYRTKAVFSLSSHLNMDYLDVNSLQMEPGDPLLDQYRFKAYPQFGFSSILYKKQWTVGFSALNLVRSKTVEQYPFTLSLFAAYFYKHPIELYYFNPQVVIFASRDNFSLQPSAVFYLKKVLKLGLQLDFDYVYSAGLMPKTGVIFGLNIKNRYFVNLISQYDYASANIFIARWHNYFSVNFKIIKRRDEVPRFF